MSSKSAPFRTTFNEKEFSKYDWGALNSNALHGNLKVLCDELRTAILKHTENQNFISHSNLHDLFNNIFSAYLLWNNFSINAFVLINSLQVDISTHCQLLILNLLSLHWAKIKLFKTNRKSKTRTEYAVYRQKYESLVLNLSPLIEPTLLKRELNAEACHSLSLFTKLKLPKTKDIDPISTLDRRRKTRLYYVQNKYNLLIEESEGFAKLITAIGEHLQSTRMEHKTQQNDKDEQDVDMKQHEKDALDATDNRLQSKIFQLIGQFKLDPNRVIDILLHGLEYDASNAILLQILRNFIPSNIVTILGFKFKHYQAANQKNKQTPKSLYILTTHLIHYNIISLSDLLPHFECNLIQKHKKWRKQFEQNEKERATLINFINLNDKVEQKEARLKKEEILYKKRGEYHTSHKSSQIFQLLLNMIQCGDWTNVEKLLHILSDIKCESKHFINWALMDLLESIITPLYNKYCSIWMILSPNNDTAPLPSPFAPLDPSLTMPSLSTLCDIIAPIISHINVYLYRRPILYGKICRILCHAMDQADHPRDDLIENIIYNLLASYSLIDNNSGLSCDLWNLLSRFNFVIRFKFYSHWKDVIYSSYCELLCQREDAIKDTKYLLRRYHVDENNEKNLKLGRMFARYINSQPVLVFDLVLKQLQSYSGNVSTVVDGFRYLTNLDRDVLIWQILCQCENNKKFPQKIRRDTYYQDWFRALCDITGHFFKQFLDCDILPILQYVINKLCVGHCDHLLIFKSIIMKLTQIEAFGEVITYKQLSCLAGSELLKQVVLQLDNKYSHYFSSRKSKIIRKISKTLINNQMLMPIFILLNNVHRSLSYDYNPNEIASNQIFDIIPTQIDLTNDMFVQLFLFMKNYIFTRYKQELYAQYPSLKELILEYKMKPNYAFMLLRLFRKEIVFDIEEVSETLALNGAITGISAGFYAIFWSLDVCDIFIPAAEYDKEIARQQDLYKKYEKDIKINKYKQSYDNDDDLYEKLRKMKKDKKNCVEIGNELKKDKEEQMKSVNKTIDIIFKSNKYHKNEWFCADGQGREDFDVFLFKCILPRITTSDIDAKYAAKFIELLINNNVPGFYLIHFLHEFLRNFNQILSSSTYSESRRVGRFLCDFMLILEKYREKKALFMAELSKLEACKYSFQTSMSYDDFCTEFRSMHRSLTIYLVHLMQSDNILWQKNAILVLNELQWVFPRVLSHAIHIKGKVGVIQGKQDKGTSMDVLCERVIAILEKGISTNKYLDEQKFGGRNLGNNNNHSHHHNHNGKEKENKINELRRKALESRKNNNNTNNDMDGNGVSASGQKRRFSEIAPVENGNNNNSPQIKKAKTDEKMNGNAIGDNKEHKDKEYKDRDRDRARKSNGSNMKLSSRSSSNGSNDRERDRDRRGSSKSQKSSKERDDVSNANVNKKDRERDRDRNDRNNRRDRNDRDRDRNERRNNNKNDRSSRDRNSRDRDRDRERDKRNGRGNDRNNDRNDRKNVVNDNKNDKDNKKEKKSAGNSGDRNDRNDKKDRDRGHREKKSSLRHKR